MQDSEVVPESRTVYQKAQFSVLVSQSSVRLLHGFTENGELRTFPPYKYIEGTMIKLVYCITRKPGLTDEEFFRYWETVHGPIGARIPRLRKLVQSHRLALPGDRHRPDYDGMAELWFDDIEALWAARDSLEWKASTEDEANFIDHNKVAYFVSEEHIILDEPKESK